MESSPERISTDLLDVSVHYALTAGLGEARLTAIQMLYRLSIEPRFRVRMLQGRALVALIAAVSDSNLHNNKHQCLAITAIGRLCNFTGQDTKANKICVINEGGIRALISVVRMLDTHFRTSHGSIMVYLWI
jgi:hypothetical protein